MQYPKFDAYKTQTPLVQKFDDDEAVVDFPVWRSSDDEFTERKHFPSLKAALQYVRGLKVPHYLIHDGHRWHEVFA